jgi:hypothetical protein
VSRLGRSFPARPGAYVGVETPRLGRPVVLPPPAQREQTIRTVIVGGRTRVEQQRRVVYSALSPPAVVEPPLQMPDRRLRVGENLVAVADRVQAGQRQPHSKLAPPSTLVRPPPVESTVRARIPVRVALAQRLPHSRLYPPTVVAAPPVFVAAPVVVRQPERVFLAPRRATSHLSRPTVLATLPVGEDRIRVRFRAAVRDRVDRARRIPRSKLRRPAVVGAALVNTVAPAMSGTCMVGSVLVTTTGTWTGSPTSFTYQWQSSADGISGWADIAGATAPVYSPHAADAGLYLRAVVTAHRASDGASASAASNACGPVIAAVVVVNQANVLGCGTYAVHVLTRGGHELVAVDLPWTALSWNRDLDDTTTAGVSGTVGLDSVCCGQLAGVHAWRHELAIYRNGELVWVGPIVSFANPPGKFQIEARDLTGWWDRRKVHENHEYAQVDVATIFQAIADDAMAPDTSPNLTVTTTGTGVKGTKRILAAQHRIAGIELRDLADLGIDWTAVGREVLAGGLVIPTDPIGLLLDEHFSTLPTVTRDGTQQGNNRGVRGAGGGEAGDTIYAEAADSDAVNDDGLLEVVDTIQTITDNVTAQSAADSRAAISKEILQVEDCQLAPSAPVPVSQLVPGALTSINLRFTCIPVNDTYRLKRVAVTAQAGQTEKVNITLQPRGTEEGSST